MTKAYVLSFEGIDNCGKGTQIELTQKYLQNHNIPLIVGREPGATAFGGALRMLLKRPELTYISLNLALADHPDFHHLPINEEKNPLSEIFAFLAARSEFFEKIVAPAIAEGRTVLADRNLDSTIAYQGFGSFGGDTKVLQAIHTSHAAILRGRNELRPAKTFLLDIPYEVMLDRAESGETDAFESRGPEFFGRVREGYDYAARMYTNRVVKIDGTLAPERIFEEGIRPHLDELFEF